jgi:hypothetical protein
MEQTLSTQVAIPFSTGRIVPHNQDPVLLTITSPEEHPGRTAAEDWALLSGKVIPVGPTLTGTAYANEVIKSRATMQVNIVIGFKFILTPSEPDVR